MNKVTAGVLAGIVLGTLHGLWSARGETAPAALVGAALGRASQGIINGILAAYFTRPRAPLWRGAVWGVVIGAALGVVRGLSRQAWMETVPPSALVGLGCGIATGLAGRARDRKSRPEEPADSPGGPEA